MNRAARFPIIGITGRARSGKDTVKDIILDNFAAWGYSFAEPMYSMARVMGVNSRDFSDAFKEQPIQKFAARGIDVSPRKLLQTLGTEWGRNLIDPQIWVSLAAEQFEDHGSGMVISDARFENEADFIRSKGGTMIHVQRSMPNETRSHVSENGIEFKDGDILITNDGTLADLESAIVEAVYAINSRKQIHS